MFLACGIWCLAEVSSVSPSSEQTDTILTQHLKAFDSSEFHALQSSDN